MPKAQRVPAAAVHGEERLHLIEEHRAKRESALGDQEAKGAAQYEAMRGVDGASMGLVAVPCPLPAYKGLSVHYRTGIPSRVRRNRPVYEEPFEIEAMREQLRAIEGDTAESRDLTHRIRAAVEVYNDEINHALAAWCALFVRGFTGWQLAPDGVPLPVPDPAEPESFYMLTQEAEDLFTWIVNDGYQSALVAATKNSEPA